MDMLISGIGSRFVVSNRFGHGCWYGEGGRCASAERSRKDSSMNKCDLSRGHGRFVQSVVTSRWVWNANGWCLKSKVFGFRGSEDQQGLCSISVANGLVRLNTISPTDAGLFSIV